MTTTTPNRCANSVMAADPTAASGKQVVLLDTGNYPSYSTFLNQTWEFSGTNWNNTSVTLVNANGPLPGRINSCMAFDGYNVVLFGGQGGSSTTGVLEDTWVWNSSAQTWTQLGGPTPPGPSLTPQPFGRYGQNCAYLVGTGVVMFGGENLLYQLLETWIWDGYTQAWSQLTFANGTSPNARVGHAMAASGSEVVLFGGQGTNSQFNDTWTFNGTTWTKLNPATSPSVRSGACMAYDSTNSVWVMFGGSNEYTYFTDTWTFNGTTWTKAVVGGGSTATPAGRVGAQMVFDPQSATTIMFGGISAATNYPSNETWSFNGATLTWTQL
jgi:Galactose oxidase, central domain